MTFSPFSFSFPSSSTSLPSSSGGKPAERSAASNSSVSQILPKSSPMMPAAPSSTGSIPKPPSPSIESITVSNLNVSEAIFHNVNSSLYCRRRHKQVIELNPTTLQLSLIETGSESEKGLSPMKFLYNLKNWPVNSTPKRILCNELGTFLAIQGTSGNVSVLKLTVNDYVSEEIEIEIGEIGEISQIAWHPASPADHHLVILSKSGKLAIFDLLQARVNFDSEESNDLKFLILSEAEQIIKLPGNRTDPFSGISFLPATSELAASWIKFTAFLVKESGDIFALCPFLPLKFKAQRQNHLLPLKKIETQPANLKWLDEVLLSCEFVASSSGDTDWVLATSPASFGHLQPRLQGPFLIQPEPMEIHHLSAYDRVVDFSIHQRSDQNLTLATIAFGSGKIDFVAVASEISSKFQLKNYLIRSVDDSDQLPIMALLESVDLGSNTRINNNRRSVDGKIKIIDQNDRYILISTDSSVVRIDLRVIEEEEEENDWSIECNASILIEKLKNHVLCLSNDKLYPGSVKLRFSNGSEDQKSTYQTSGILETITKFAFPLGKMEIEGGAVQLESLAENLIKILKRLKSHGTIKSTLKLPEIDEIGATELNDQVSEWQESLVSSAMRVGHEIALRSNELVQILRREREILVRAKTLLTVKPERLQLLMKKLREAKEQNQKLLERTRKTCQELSKYSVYDEVLIQKIQEISSNLAGHSLTKPEFNEFVVLEDDDSDLIQSQLLMQSEKLLKLKEQLQIKNRN
jgi:hypothetical protein